MKQKIITLLLLLLLIATANRFRSEVAVKLDRLSTVKEFFLDKRVDFLSGFGLKTLIKALK